MKDDFPLWEVHKKKTNYQSVHTAYFTSLVSEWPKAVRLVQSSSHDQNTGSVMGRLPNLVTS